MVAKKIFNEQYLTEKRENSFVTKLPFNVILSKNAKPFSELLEDAIKSLNLFTFLAFSE